MLKPLFCPDASGESESNKTANETLKYPDASGQGDAILSRQNTYEYY